jgi:hypothetical protein
MPGWNLDFETVFASFDGTIPKFRRSPLPLVACEVLGMEGYPGC